MTILICLDAERINTIENSINEWLKFIMQLTEKFYPSLGLSKVDAMKNKSTILSSIAVCKRKEVYSIYSENTVI